MALGYMERSVLQCECICPKHPNFRTCSDPGRGVFTLLRQASDRVGTANEVVLLHGRLQCLASIVESECHYVPVNVNLSDAEWNRRVPFSFRSFSLILHRTMNREDGDIRELTLAYEIMACSLQAPSKIHVCVLVDSGCWSSFPSGTFLHRRLGP